MTQREAVALHSAASGRMALEALYVKHCASGSAIAAHLPHLRQLALGCALAVEFGVKKAQSTVALLLGADRVVSYDTVATPEAQALARAEQVRWSYRIEDSRTVTIPPADLLLFDSLHTFDQVQTELVLHGDQIRKYLVFHDVTTFGEVGAVGETGQQAWTYQVGQSVPRAHWGIRPAIDLFQMSHPWWRLVHRTVESHGLLVLERQW